MILDSVKTEQYKLIIWRGVDWAFKGPPVFEGTPWT